LAELRPKLDGTLARERTLPNPRFREKPMNMQLPAPRSGSRDRAIVADDVATDHVPLCSVWHELASRSSRVLDAFFTEQRCYALMSPSVREGPPALDARQLRILETVLCGQGQKTAAIELGLAPSTVALIARTTLEAVGIRGKPSRVHPLFMFAAISARLELNWKRVRKSAIDAPVPLRVLSIPRPELNLFQEFPHAELRVLAALVEGRSYEDVAHLRGTSVRTIANQAASVFRRLEVSGRSQLLCKLFTLAGEDTDSSRRVTTLLPAPYGALEPSGSMPLCASG
jgi:DNA-binding NarL/FixJ family response regulator